MAGPRSRARGISPEPTARSTGTSIDYLSPTGYQLNDQLTFTAAAGSLGQLQVIQYLDQDVTSAIVDDLLYPSGTVASNNFLLYTLNQTERVGLGQGGQYVPTAGLMSNMSFEGFAADMYDDLETNIQGPGVAYSPTGAGTINLANLPSSIDPILHQKVYGPNDVTDAMAWKVNAAATTATVTPFLNEIVASAPVIQTALPNLQVHVPYTNTIQVQFGTPPYRLTVSAGSLPPGMTLNPVTHVFTGTPTTAGTYNFTLSATDAASSVGTRVYTIIVQPPPVGPATTLLVNLPNSILVNRLYTFTVQAAVDVYGDPSITPSNLTYPTTTFLYPSSRVLQNYYILTPVSRSADGTTWTYHLIARRLGPLYLDFMATLDYPAAQGGNKTLSDILRTTVIY